jgi:hypothetical protein
MSDMPRGTIFGRRVGDQPETFVEHFIRCPTCGGWIDYRDLGHVLDHEGPLPHRRDQSSSALRWFGTPREVISTPALTEMTRP